MIVNLWFSLLFKWTIILSYSESFVIHFRDETSRGHGTLQNRNVKFPTDSNIYFPKQQHRRRPGNNRNRPSQYVENNYKAERLKPAVIEFIEDFGVPRIPVFGLSSFRSDSGVIADKSSHPCGVNANFGDRKYRYDKITKKCYAVGAIGPCSQNMIFYENPENEINGYCDCIKHDSRTFINYQITQQCYPIFSQGYCPNGKWLVLNFAGHPYCDINPCYAIQKQEPYKEFVYFNSRCVELNTNQPECTRNEVVAFVPYQIQPDCTMLLSKRGDFAFGASNSRRQPFKL